MGYVISCFSLEMIYRLFLFMSYWLELVIWVFRLIVGGWDVERVYGIFVERCWFLRFVI